VSGVGIHIHAVSAVRQDLESCSNFMVVSSLSEEIMHQVRLSLVVVIPHCFVTGLIHSRHGVLAGFFADVRLVGFQ